MSSKQRRVQTSETRGHLYIHKKYEHLLAEIYNMTVPRLLAVW